MSKKFIKKRRTGHAVLTWPACPTTTTHSHSSRSAAKARQYSTPPEVTQSPGPKGSELFWCNKGNLNSSLLISLCLILWLISVHTWILYKDSFIEWSYIWKIKGKHLMLAVKLLICCGCCCCCFYYYFNYYEKYSMLISHCVISSSVSGDKHTLSSHNLKTLIFKLTQFLGSPCAIGAALDVGPLWGDCATL